MTEFRVERQVISQIVGTAFATLLGATPPQMSAEIYDLRYTNLTTGSVVAYLLQQEINTGYTAELASLIDSVSLNGPVSVSNDNANAPVTKVSPGNALVAFATSGSIFIRATYEYVYGR